MEEKSSGESSGVPHMGRAGGGSNFLPSTHTHIKWEASIVLISAVASDGREAFDLQGSPAIPKERRSSKFKISLFSNDCH